MLSKNQIKNCTQLQQKKFRKETGSFIAEGPKVVNEFLHSDIKIAEIYGLEDWVKQNILLIEQKKCAYFIIDETELAKISALQTPNEVLIICKQPVYDEKNIDKNASLFLYLDGIGDPGNLGTIIRMADWFGVKQIFCSANCAEVFNPKVVQSTMGSLTRVTILNSSLENICTQLNITHIFGATLSGENIYTTSIPKKSMLVIGSESHGISKENIALLSKQITIPQVNGGKTESLNAAVATSILLSEIFRKTNYTN